MGLIVGVLLGDLLGFEVVGVLEGALEGDLLGLLVVGVLEGDLLGTKVGAGVVASICRPRRRKTRQTSRKDLIFFPRG